MPYLVAITGGSGSGKSTLANGLAARLGAENCAILSDDCYYKARHSHSPDVMHLKPDEVARTINFDDPGAKDMDLLLKDIEDLKNGQTISQPIYDFTLHDRREDQSTPILPRPVIIAEGIHILSDPTILPLFDLKVFVDTPADLRLARRVLRDTKERDRKIGDIIEQYMNFVRASHQQFTEPAKYICDIVVADEGLPAYRSEQEDRNSSDRLLAPVLSRLLADNQELQIKA